jgi:hypothetical protein
MAALFAACAVIEALRCSSLASLTGGDIWWHISSGLWILQHHALPHTGLFSQSSQSPWIAASWLYDVRFAIAYKLFGLAAIPMSLMVLRSALAVVTFLLAGGRCGNFWSAIALSAIAQYLLIAFPPTPTYVSIIFVALELLVLLHLRRDAAQCGAGTPARVPRTEFLLPLLFLLWANLDIHFIYGLALLLLFLAASFREASPIAPNLAKIAALSLFATLLTPYFYRPYSIFFSTIFSPANSILPDYKALTFRQPSDYVFLLFAMSAFLALGLRRSRDFFLLPLLVVAASLSFHAQRDLWLVVLVAVTVLGQSITAPTTPRVLPRQLGIAMAATLATLILAAAFVVPNRPEALQAKAATSYPVAAADYIRDHHLPQPLFNAFEWGGFLTLYLPEYPVAIDGRTDLYGDDFVVQYSKVMNAEVRYTDFPALANAATILLPRNAIMAGALASLPNYKVVYSDNVSTVLTKESP